MRKKKNKSKDPSKNNLLGLIDLYDQYRQLQYDIFKQYNLCLEDPKFDELYMDMNFLEHYRGYIENDLNGNENYSSTTEIIKDLKKFLEQYEAADSKIDTTRIPTAGDTLANER